MSTIAEIAKALKIPPIMVVGENNRGAVNLGQFTNLRPGSKGGLTADIEVPKAIHGLAKQQLIRNLSMEILHNVMVNGKFYPMVIKAGCLLGRENPAIPLSDFKLSERQGFGEFSTYTLSEFVVSESTQLAGPTTGDVHQPSILKRLTRQLRTQSKFVNSPGYHSVSGDTDVEVIKGTKYSKTVSPQFATAKRIHIKKNPHLYQTLKSKKKSSLKWAIKGALKRLKTVKLSNHGGQTHLSDIHKALSRILLKNARRFGKTDIDRRRLVDPKSQIRKFLTPSKGVVEHKLNPESRWFPFRDSQNSEYALENRRAIGLAPRRTKYTQTSGHGKNRNQGYIRKDIDRPIGAIKKLLKGKIPSPLQILRAGEKFYNSELASRVQKYGRIGKLGANLIKCIRARELQTLSI